VRLEESLLALTEIESSLEYKSKSKANIGFTLSLYTSSSFTSLLLSSLLSPIEALPHYYNESAQFTNNYSVAIQA